MYNTLGNKNEDIYDKYLLGELIFYSNEYQHLLWKVAKK
jgi:hypothetical protein